ncbi:MAG TPA: YkgJ family cysteine cluster protein [Spirochaetota bacterium]|nr:YkgJ family cysteine cluster protein [Spirochaetota bacterium]
MRRIAYLSGEVRCLLSELDEALAVFSSRIDTSCPPGCITCCQYPDVQATVLEFLPLACRLLEEGRAESILDRIEHQPETLPGCVFADETGCPVYQDRGLICRLFSASVRVDRLGRLEYVACSILHTRHGRHLPAETLPPVMSDWGLRLEAIDPVLGSHWYPVNEAIRRALEMVLYSNHLDQAG